jgi:hypothetical protein
MVYHRDSYFARVFVGMLIQWPMRFLLAVFRNRALPGWLRRRLPNGFVEIYRVLAHTRFSQEKLLALTTDPSWSGKGNSNPLSKYYSRGDAVRLFKQFRTCSTEIRLLHEAGFLPRSIHRWIEQHWGWFLYVRALK